MVTGITKPPVGKLVNKGHFYGKNCIAAYLFNEGSGSNLYDLSAKRVWDDNNHGTLQNTPTWVPNGLCFEQAQSEYVLLPDTGAFNVSEGTIICWFILETVNSFHGGLFHMGQTADGAGIPFRFIVVDSDIAVFGSKLFVTVDAGAVTNNVYGDTQLSLDVLYQAVVTGDGIEYKFYLNGIDDGLNIQAGANNGVWLDVPYGDYSTRQFNIGRMFRQTGGHQDKFDGTMLAQFHFDKALSPAEILHNYYKPMDMFYPSLELPRVLPFGFVAYPRLSGMGGGILEGMQGGLAH
jgi:hypothetical protein